MSKNNLLSVPFNDPAQAFNKFLAAKKNRKEMEAEHKAFIEWLNYQVTSNSYTEEEKKNADRTVCHRMFAENFWTDDMSDDILNISKSYIKHNINSIRKTDEYFGFFDGDMSAILLSRFFSMVFDSFLNGDDYSRQFLIHIYKKYRKKEYNQLRKFSKLMPDDVYTIVGEDNSCNFAEARVLGMAEVLNIDVSECGCVYIFLEKQKEKITKRRQEGISMLKEEMENAQKDEIDEKLLKKTVKKLNKSDIFIKTCFVNDGYALEYKDWYCETCYDNASDYEKFVREAYQILKVEKEDIEPDAETLAYFTQLRMLVKTVTEIGNNYMTIINAMFSDYEDFVDINTDTKEDKIEDIVVDDNADKYKETIKQLKKELDETRKLVKKQDDIQNTNRELKKEIKQLKEKEALLRDQYEKDKIELSALREHVYNMTNIIDNKEISVDEMSDNIKDFNILIIGGDDKWQIKLKSIFPDWKYINATVTGTIDSRIVFGRDMIYIFTDLISHSTYNKYMSVIKEHNIPVSFIHENNIERNIKQIYGDLIK